MVLLPATALLIQAIARRITPLYLSRVSRLMSAHRKRSHAELAGPQKNRRHDRSSSARSGLLLGFLPGLRLTQEIAQRDGQVGQNTEQ